MLEQICGFSGAKVSAVGPGLRAAAGLPGGRVWNEAAPPQTLSKSCARAGAVLFSGLESPSSTRLAFPAATAAKCKHRIFGAKSRGNEGRGIILQSPPSQVVESAELSPSPRRRKRGRRWQAELSSISAEPAGARSPARPAADAQQQRSRPSRRCPHSAPLGASPRGLLKGRTLVPTSCFSRIGTNMLPLPFL